MHPNLACSLEQAAALARLDPFELAWSIEQFGRCDTDTFTVFPSDDDGYFIVRPVSR